MPIYEYQAFQPHHPCHKCGPGFEVFQGIREKPLSTCPSCGGKIKKVISWCRSAIIETSEEDRKVAIKVEEYERSGMWSHAAELADKHSEKSNDENLKIRALDNYKKAGYDVDTLTKHAKKEKK